MHKQLVQIVLICFYFAMSFKPAIAEYRPKVNQNTQTRIEYGCKRPKQWKMTKKVYPVYFEDKKNNKIKVLNFNCNISTRDEILISLNASDDTNIEYNFFFKDQKTNKWKYDNEFLKKTNRKKCKVVKGQWIVENEAGDDIVVDDPKLLQIDHILPFSYIRLNMKDCSKITEYYNFTENLEPVLAEVNKKKSDIICETKEMCERQKAICQKMSEHFEDEHLCDEINKIKLEENIDIITNNAL